MEIHPIILDGEPVGKANVEKRGLYYYITCVCDIQSDKPVCVTVYCSGKEQKLGICVPENGLYTLRKHIPMKQIGKSTLRFCAEYEKAAQNNIIKISSRCPFAPMAFLENARLLIKNGEFYICWRKEK